MNVIVEGLGEGIEEGIVAGIAEVNVGVVAEGVVEGIAGTYEIVEITNLLLAGQLVICLRRRWRSFEGSGSSEPKMRPAS